MEKEAPKKFWVMLARPVIQTTIVEVIASSSEEAEDKAQRKAKKLPQSAWSGAFQKKDYGLDVVACLPDSDFEPDENPEQYLSDTGLSLRYLLLKADLDFGTGQLLVEPWLEKCSSVAIADFLGDWSAATKMLYEESVGEMYDWLVQRSAEKQKEREPNAATAKVIFLRPYLDKKQSKKPESDD